LKPRLTAGQYAIGTGTSRSGRRFGHLSRMWVNRMCARARPSGSP
jgi:hypothetical protein